LKVHYCSAPCGSGKTYQIIERACELAGKGHFVVVLQPTKELIDRTIERELLGRPVPPRQSAFYSTTGISTSVGGQLTEFFKNPSDQGHIVFATHQVLPFIPFWANKNQWHVFIDEELQVVKHGCFNVPNTHHLISDHIDLVSQDSIYCRVVASNPDALSKIAGNRNDDQIYEQFRETAQILTNRNWDSFVNTEQFCALRNGRGSQLSIHSILKPSLLNGFASVTITSANFCDSLTNKLWRKMGVEFIEDVKLSKALRFQEHTNGSLITIKYFIDREWTKTFRFKKSDPNDDESQFVLPVMIEAVKTEFGELACPRFG
jgi:Type III restriction enzyme, res subunit